MKFNELADKVTAEIISELEKGNAVFQQPWRNSGRAKNYVSKRSYTGFNQFYLSMCSEKYSTPYYITFKQAKELGGNVKKGEKSTSVVYWLVGVKNSGKAEPVGADEQETTSGKLTFYPIIYHVFNIDQVEGIDFKTDYVEPVNINNPVEACEEIINNMPQRPEIKSGGDRACFSPALDLVKMPEMKYFVSSEHYYSTLFHELIHSTGHKSRLNRFKEGEAPARFGDEQYSKEELTAELGAAYLCNVVGIENEATKNNHVGYLKSWIAALKNDTTMIIYAAQRAYKATAFILNEKEEEQQEAREHAQAAR